MRDQLAALLIQLGFWSQIVLLGLVDWGTLYWWNKDWSPRGSDPSVVVTHGIPWYHVVGLVVMNVVLLTSAAFTWRYLSRQRFHATPPPDLAA